MKRNLSIVDKKNRFNKSFWPKTEWNKKIAASIEHTSKPVISQRRLRTTHKKLNKTKIFLSFSRCDSFVVFATVEMISLKKFQKYFNNFLEGLCNLFFNKIAGKPRFLEQNITQYEQKYLTEKQLEWRSTHWPKSIGFVFIVSFYLICVFFLRRRRRRRQRRTGQRNKKKWPYTVSMYSIAKNIYRRTTHG